MSRGRNEESFWIKTPRQIERAFEADAARFRREHNERAWLAYHIAVLTRTTKRFTLESMLARDGKKPQTWQQQLAIAKMWTAHSAGKIKSRK